MKRVLVWAVALALVAVAAPAAIAGGSGKKQKKPSEGSQEEQAVEAYNTGIAARDNAWEIEKGDADARKLEAVYRSAAASFKKAIGLNPEMYEAHSELGYVLRKLGDYEKSIAAYDRALEIEPKYAQAIEYRAEAYLGLNRLDEAKAAYMQLFEGQSDQAAALLEAMQKWCETNDDDEFSAWVDERAALAGQAKSVSQLGDADW